jgi:hypothetical protein
LRDAPCRLVTKWKCPSLSLVKFRHSIASFASGFGIPRFVGGNRIAACFFCHFPPLSLDMPIFNGYDTEAYSQIRPDDAT